MRTFVFLIMLATSLTAINSCTPFNPCDGQKCYNGGLCLDGTCLCPYGWGGDSCTVVLDSCVFRNCGPHAAGCHNNTCECLNGYEGDSCHIVSRDKFFGAFTATEDCMGIISNYTMYFEPSILESTMLVRGLHNLPLIDSLRPTIFVDSFRIPVTYIVNGTYRVQGGAKINPTHDTIWLNFTFARAPNINIDTACTAVLVRQ